MTPGPLLEPGRIGPVTTRNRLVRAGTAEALATAGGAVTAALVEVYEALARGGAGLVLTGHLYVHPRGKCAPNQPGAERDDRIGGLARLARAVHARGGRILAQLSHAGGQTRVPGNHALTPSGVPNPLTGNAGSAATGEEVEEVVEAFAAAARRVAEAGFDGVHVHGGNGYLLSEFASPLTNLRDDAWRAVPGHAGALPLRVVRAVRAALPDTCATTMKVGAYDALPGGLDADGPLGFAGELAGEGLDGIEVTCNLMGSYRESIRPYVAVGPREAARDLLPHRLLRRPPGEAYFLPLARRMRAVTGVPLIVAGGFRTTQAMTAAVASGDADFVALARPLIREPDLPAQIAAGRSGQVACTSCNLCLRYQGPLGVRCWRTPRRRLLAYGAHRLRRLGSYLSPTNARNDTTSAVNEIQ